jgi:hypothetical protein
VNEEATAQAVRRWALAPVRWCLLLALLISPLVMVDVRDALAGRKPIGPAVTGTVDARYDGGDEVPVTYVHPVTQQQVETDVFVWDRRRLPRAGGQLNLIADVDNPSTPTVSGDRFPAEQNLLAYGWLPLVPLLAAGARLARVRQVRRLQGSAQPTFAMLGAVSGPGAFGRRPLVHLYALDAQPGDAPVCVVPLAATGGLPLAGPAVPIEVKGIPAPGGRLVLRSESRAAWPAGRALLYSRDALPRPARVEPVGVPAPSARAHPPRAGLRLPQPLPGWWLGWRAPLLVAALVLAVAVAASTLLGARQAARLYAAGEPTLARVVAANPDLFELEVAYRSSGDEATAIAPADFPEDFDVGVLYPAVVSPDDPGLVRLRAERYDAVEPIVWGSIPLLVALALTASSATGRWHVRRARRLPTRPVDAWTEGELVALAQPGTDQVLCLVRMAGVHERAVVPPRAAVQLHAAGPLMPEQPVALRAGEQWLDVGGSARATAEAAALGWADVTWP